MSKNWKNPTDPIIIRLRIDELNEFIAQHRGNFQIKLEKEALLYEDLPRVKKFIEMTEVRAKGLYGENAVPPRLTLLEDIFKQVD